MHQRRQNKHIKDNSRIMRKFHPESHVQPETAQIKMARQDIEALDFFAPKEKSTSTFFKRYSPIICTMLMALMTYFYIIFYLFYPKALLQGHYLQLLLLIVFVFLVMGLFSYLGLKAELMFVRILSFIFVFVIFTFLLLFVLIANSMMASAVP